MFLQSTHVWHIFRHILHNLIGKSGTKSLTTTFLLLNTLVKFSMLDIWQFILQYTRIFTPLDRGEMYNYNIFFTRKLVHADKRASINEQIIATR